MTTVTMRIGELATATGLTVRTLRHYESVGLLEPVARTESGYRVYRMQDAERLYAIVTLRRLGLSLAEIRSTLGADAGQVRSLVQRHAAEVRTRLSALVALQVTLERLDAELGSTRRLSLAELCELVRLTTEASAPRHLGEEPEALGVLADPEAGRILDRLQRRGPATIETLSTDLGQARGGIRRRVEQLAHHGFVEKDSERTGAWRIVPLDLRLPQVERTAESDAIARSWFEPSVGALLGFLERADEWRDSATLSNAMLHLTRDELERFGAEYIALVRRYARPVEGAPEGARTATALMFAFPREEE